MRFKNRDLERKIRFFVQLAPFDALDALDLVKFASAFRVQTFKKGDVISAEGSEKADLFVLATGECRVLKSLSVREPAAAAAADATTTPQHFAHVEMGVLHEGDIFGDECAFWSSATALEPPTASRTPASVVAASPCEVYYASPASIKLHETPAVAEMMRTMHAHLAQIAEVLSDASTTAHLQRGHEWRRLVEDILSGANPPSGHGGGDRSGSRTAHAAWMAAKLPKIAAHRTPEKASAASTRRRRQ